ncbi:hypothetical protein [Noviherbaspirillum cavernae]|nr:hypothetical protein [Noviherbaspirillum cavernae]
MGDQFKACRLNLREMEQESRTPLCRMIVGAFLFFAMTGNRSVMSIGLENGFLHDVLGFVTLALAVSRDESEMAGGVKTARYRQFCEISKAA